MQTIDVDKARLIETLRENKAAHIEAFNAAWEGFTRTAAEKAQAMVLVLSAAKPGQQVSLHISLTPPENHAEDYERALQMCEWEKRDTVSLEQHEFVELVQDEWGWKRQFVHSGMAYVADSSAYPGLR